MLKIAVFVSGRGSNLSAVINSIKSDDLNAEVEFVVSDKIFCEAFNIAAENNIATYSVSETPKDGCVDYNLLADVFKKNGIGLIVLAGFLKKIPAEFIGEFNEKIINIHPALLPSFGGKGMYGLNVHKAVFDRSCKVSGATVHFVDNVYDNGKIIAQYCTEIYECKSPEEIAAKVLKLEHKLLPFVIGKFADNKVIINKRVEILE